MAGYEPKTRPTDASVEDFLNGVSDETRREDAFRLLETFRRLTGYEPVMWGPSIVGFGSQRLKYASGQELDWPVTGFSPRKSELVLYIMEGLDEHSELMSRLGKHRTGKACLYIKRLSDVNEEILERLIADSFETVKLPDDE